MLELQKILPLVDGERSAKPLRFQFRRKWCGVCRIFFSQQKVLPRCGIIVDRVWHHNERTGSLRKELGLGNLVMQVLCAVQAGIGISSLKTNGIFADESS